MNMRATRLPLPTDPSPEVINALLREDLYSFSVKAFQQVFPGIEYLPSWHHKVIAHHLMQVLDGKITRLIINVPPRSLKSYLSVVSFVAFMLGRRPSANVVCVSYSQELANKHARDCRALMESTFYRELFPGARLNPKRTTESDFMTMNRGGRLATSIGGTLTGRGGGYVIIDDPMKPDEAASETARLAVIDWFRNTVLSRLDDKSRDVIILVMQRVHEDDLAGVLMQDPSWHVLELPAVAEADVPVPLTFGRTKLRREGEVLSPTREPFEVLEQLKRTMGSYDFAAQYQQRPAPKGGGLVKWDWFRTYDEPLGSQGGDRIVQSWDVANTISETADYSVCTTWLLRNGDSYLLHVLRMKLEYPALKNLLISHAAGFHATTVLIENKSAGEPLIQELRQIPGIHPVARDPKGDKETRMYIETPQIEAGRVLIPAEAAWLAEFRAEICAFPKGKHDDQVDSVSQYLNWVREVALRPGPRLSSVEPASRFGTYYSGGLSDFMRRG